MKMQPDQFLRVWDEIKLQLRGRIGLVTGMPDIVDNLLQDIFVSVYPKAAGLHESYAAKYLMRAATNAAKSYLASRWASKAEYFVPELLTLETPHISYEVRESWNLYARKIVPTLAQLPQRLRSTLEAYMEFSKRMAGVQGAGNPAEHAEAQAESWPN
jgi:DNA-directed RNA polymerase specialized sigma24 family protein